MSVLKVAVVATAVAVTAMLLVSSSSTAAQVVEHDYVGAERCKSCHEAAYTAWSNSPHARAYEVLSATERKDPRCLSCHTAVPGDVQQALAGVQCESCHGAGRHYTPEHVMRDADLAALLGLVAKVEAPACMRCHTDNAPSLSPFDFAGKRQLIKHWNEAPGAGPSPAARQESP